MLLECGAFALMKQWNNSKTLILGLQLLLCSPCCCACYKDQISWFIVLPPTGHHPHSSFCTKPHLLLQRSLLFINFSHICKHAERERGWPLSAKHFRECCYSPLSKFPWMRLKRGNFPHENLLIFEMQKLSSLSSESLTLCLLMEQLLYAWKVLFITCLRRENEILQSSNSALDTLLEIKTTVTEATSL